MTRDEEVTDILEAIREADEVLHFAILDFLGAQQEHPMANTLLGMQFALLRHAARLQLILNPKASKDKFVNAAAVEFDDVAQYRKENPPKDPQKNPPKSPGLQVVK